MAQNNDRQFERIFKQQITTVHRPMPKTGSLVSTAASYNAATTEIIRGSLAKR